jgi:pyridoxal phosphate enzyme (YggS family)
MIKIANKLEKIEAGIADACRRVGRDRSEITIVVVTKTVEIDSIKEALKLGYSDFGENRVQHLRQVAADVQAYAQSQEGEAPFPPNIKWHMIGHLQRNKVKQVLDITSLIHSVDTLRLAEEINDAAVKADIQAGVLLQVNCSGEPQKYGVPVGAATHLAEQIATMDNLRLCGLMTMAPLTMNKDIVRACFVRARELFEEIRGERVASKDFCHLSMGMSQDYEIAVEEGATILRIGSAIFAM